MPAFKRSTKLCGEDKFDTYHARTAAWASTELLTWSCPFFFLFFRSFSNATGNFHLSRALHTIRSALIRVTAWAKYIGTFLVGTAVLFAQLEIFFGKSTS